MAVIARFTADRLQEKLLPAFKNKGIEKDPKPNDKTKIG